MIALHAGVMFCTEITDALWKRYLSQHPENLIDEDSSLINFARYVLFSLKTEPSREFAFMSESILMKFEPRTQFSAISTVCLKSNNLTDPVFLIDYFGCFSSNLN